VRSRSVDASRTIGNVSPSKRGLLSLWPRGVERDPALEHESLFQVLAYIHHIPVRGKWALVDDYTTYPYSSASFYETGIGTNFTAFDYRVL
jgi:hypothetical protein